MGDGKMLSLMNMQGKEARQMMWGIWGVNHVFVSILKVIAVRENDQRMMKMLLWTVLPTLYFLIANNANMAAAGGDTDWICGVDRSSNGQFELFGV